MNILLTGATGLLGSAVLPILASQHNVSVISRREKNNNELKNVNWIVCDLSKTFNKDLFPDQIDVIVHLAQSKLYKTFPKNILDIYEVNVASTAKLLDYAYSAKAKNFIYASSGSVYYPYQGPLNESQLLDPVDFYANSKLAAERLILSFQSFFPVCIFRLFFLYGSAINDSLVNKLICKIRNRQPIFIDGSGGGMVLTPTINSDVARYINQVIDRPLQGIYNLSGPQAISIKDLSLKIGKCVGVEPIFEHNVTSKPFIMKPDLSKIASSHLASPLTSIEEGLKYIIEDHKS